MYRHLALLILISIFFLPTTFPASLAAAPPSVVDVPTGPPAPALERLDITKASIDRPALGRFLERHPGAWEVRWDRRSDRPHLVQGAGVPVLPGRGNHLRADTTETMMNTSTGALAERLLGLVGPELLGVDGLELRLDRDRSLQLGTDGAFRTVELGQFHDSLPIEGAKVYFRLSHGNLVQFGSRGLAPVLGLSTEPSLSADEAVDAVRARLGGSTDGVLLAPPSLLIVLVDPDAVLPGTAWKSLPGTGWDHRLAWALELALPTDAVVRARVDAHAGSLLQLSSLGHQAEVRGEVRLLDGDAALTSVPFPRAAVTDAGGSKVTDASGIYAYAGGTATARLDGPYAGVSDFCGEVELSDAIDGNLDFGGVGGDVGGGTPGGGTDCATPSPGLGGAGNTDAARTAFYHATRINRRVAPHLPFLDWLDQAPTVEVNRTDNPCNASFGASGVGTLRLSASGFHPNAGFACTNTGEIPSIVVHEWAHGLDRNDGSPASDPASSEAMADVLALVDQRDACIGRGLHPGLPCHNCRTPCDGVRDPAAFAQGGPSTIAAPWTITDDAGLDCDGDRDFDGQADSCPYKVGALGIPFHGPLGYAPHCESQVASAAAWDLAADLQQAHGEEEGWAAMEALWLASLPLLQDAYRLDSGGQCNSAALTNGCEESNWYTVFLGLDDDDGNLANGTPNGCRIWDALGAHGMACGSRPACFACPFPADPALAEAPEPYDHFGDAVAIGDFDCDGFDDLAVGTPGEAVPGTHGATVNDAGLVTIYFGRDGSMPNACSRREQLHASTGLDASYVGSRFGQALAVGDFDDDTCDDLAVAFPGVSGEQGMVRVFYGNTDADLRRGSHLLYRNHSRVPGNAAPGDRFGDKLAAGDLDGDGFDDLAVTVPGDGSGSLDNAGAVLVFYGEGSGLTPGSAIHDTQLLHQDQPGIPGVREASDGVSMTVAIGNFDGDAYDDLAIGYSKEDLSATNDGWLLVLYGSSSGVTTAGQQSFGQGDVHGTGPEIRDYFAAHLAAGDLDGDGIDDLAVASPGEDWGSVVNTGVVHVLWGEPSGLASDSRYYLASGWGDGDSADTWFGNALAIGDADGDGLGDLVIGATGTDIDGIEMGGKVLVGYGSASRSLRRSTESSGVYSFHRLTPGIDGEPESYAGLGSALALGDLDGDGVDDLAAAARWDRVSFVSEAGSITVVPGSDQGTPGLRAHGSVLLVQD